MREGPGVDVFFLIATVSGLLVALGEAYRAGADALSWEMRWRDLDPTYRNWLAAMATSRSWLRTLDDPGEVELARGAARRESRRRAPFDLAGLALVVIVAALAVAGVVPGSAAGSAFSIYILLHLLLGFLRNRQIRRSLVERSDSEDAPPRQGTAPAWS